jgi:hypothetical protein
MPKDATRAVRPLVDFVDRVDIPLTDFLDIRAVPILDEIMVADVWTDLGPDGFVLGADFHLGGIADLHLPGLNQFSLSFNSDAFARGVMTCGLEPSLELEELEITLRIDPAILRSRDGTGATITTSCRLRLDREGFHFLAFSEALLTNAYVAGTDIELTLEGISWGDNDKAFLRVREGALVMPMFTAAAGAPLRLTGTGIVFGRDGPSGRFAKADGPPLTVTLYGFTCALERTEITLEHGQMISVDLGGRLDLSAFLSKGRKDGWVPVDFSIGRSGVAAALSNGEAIVDMKVDGMFALAVDTIRLEAGVTDTLGTLWLSGELTPEIDQVEGGWPALAFDEIGIGPAGGCVLPKARASQRPSPSCSNGISSSSQ